MKLVQTRRAVVAALSLTAIAPQTFAHHGWSSFDETKPIYLEGTVKSVKWQNPHAELVLDLTRNATMPSGLSSSQVPKQTAPVDASSVLGRATVPMRKDAAWTVELAPLSRIDAWKVEPVKVGEKIAVVGYTFKDEKGDAVLRAEFLIRGTSITPLRSGPG
ncbi:MAG: hypothetical protein RL341_981 [Pseudomonadota bacterium]|jgi:hypothetical protein